MARITLNEIAKEMNIGDKLRIVSEDPDFYYYGWYSGIVAEIVDKVHTSYSVGIEIRVRCQPMSYIKDENGKRKPSGKLSVNENSSPSYKLYTLSEPENNDYWFETIE